ncbi:MAG: RdgB/HAM1 family non-canonical purine NTP pyrophosphatase, partial [Oscillospiraceae bacterium]|nr:RdgB/HAM1 family non-canonical purine NTP pyrophosphatase [Oscillospiraceae bacterium]
MKLILASNNANKLKEFRSLTADLDIELLSQKEAGCDFEVEENGTTFEENAYLKASAVTAATGFAAVADDSGLCVDALNGEPGIYSARYGLGHDASDQDRYRYLLQKMEGVENRSARFVCCICCTFPDGSVIRSRGECEGEILLSPKGRNGFGYDPVFHPLGLEKSMAELSP